MRLPRWLTPMLSVCLVATISRSGWAQSYPNYPAQGYGGYEATAPGEFIPGVPSMPYGAVGYPQGQGMTPADAAWAQYGPAAAGGQATMDAMGSAGYPPSAGMMPWPQNGNVPSAYSSRFSQHTNPDGIWRYESSNKPNSYFFGLEYLSTHNQRPNKGIIGDNNSISYYEMVQSSLDDVDSDLSTEFEFYNYYDAQNFGILSDNNTPGMRGRWGFTRPDDTGFVFELWWASDKQNIWDAEKLGSTRQQDPSQMDELQDLLSAPDFLDSDVTPFSADEILQRNLLNLRGLPLDDGSRTGVTVPYDLGYRIEVTSESFGAAANVLMTPTMKTNTFMLRPLWGVRYLNVQEGFRFVGSDSGLLYDDNAETTDPPTADLKLQSLPNGSDTDGNDIIDDAGIVEGIVEPDSGSGSGGSSGSDVENITDEVGFRAVTDPFTAYLANSVTTHMAGPEVGFRYDLGGSKFLLWGQTKVGLMGNNEKLKMRGDNIGMATRGDLLEATPGDPHPNRFSDVEEHNHVSPLFEQGVFAEWRIFEDIPFLDEIYLLEDAKLKIGVTYIAAGVVARPFDNVSWQGNPSEGLFPQLKVDRQLWSTLNYSIGIDWTY